MYEKLRDSREDVGFQTRLIPLVTRVRFPSLVPPDLVSPTLTWSGTKLTYWYSIA